MNSEQKLAEFRQWALAVLDLLSADSGRQVAYLRASGVGADEMLLQFDDVLNVARARVADGSLNREDYLLLQSVNGNANSVSAGPVSIWTESALEEAVEWEELRAASGVVKSRLERSWVQGFGE